MTNKLELPQQRLDSASAVVGILTITVALIALSLAAIFIRLSEEEIGPNATVFNRLWIATLVFCFWKGLKTADWQDLDEQNIRRSPHSRRQIFLLVLVGVVSSASVVCWAWSLTQTSVANSTVLRNLTPIFTSFGGWLLLNQRFERRFIVGMVLAIVGAIAIGWDDFQISTDNLIGDTVALLSALFYAINLLIVERLRAKELTTTTILLWRCAIGAILLFPVVLLTEDRLFPYFWQGWLAVIGLAIVCQVFGQGLLVYSLKKFSSGFIAVFLLLEPVLTAIFAWIIFAERLNLYNWIAFSLVLAGIYLAKSSSYTANVKKYS